MIKLIAPLDFYRNTQINGNTDDDKIIPFLKIAQELYVKQLLGDSLYNKITTDFDNNTLSGVYLTIYEDYVKYLIIWKASSLFIEQNAYMISNNGITKLKSEDSEGVSKSEIDYLVKSSEKIYNEYRLQFEKYLKTIDIPEILTKCEQSRIINVGGFALRK